VCQEGGAAIAVTLFPHVGALGMVMLRLAFSALILLAVARPRLRGHGASAWRDVIVFGVVLGTMNGLFYLALQRLPLG
jgi:inner membrane transporter RhtA